MIIQHNMEAANAQRQYKINVGEKSRTVEKLSSGYRINRAADDAAGLTISEESAHRSVDLKRHVGMYRMEARLSRQQMGL